MGKKNLGRSKRLKRPEDVWKDVRNFQTDDDLREIWELMQNTTRNDPCWCNSGEKYKNCHLDRSREAPLKIHEYIKVMRKFFDKGRCLHPEADPTVCVGPIVKAHTIQKNGGLSRIASNGHVYTFFSEKNLSKDFLISPSLVGIQKASTFTGFCAFHDSTTFAPVETHPFQSIPQHTFLLGYRTLCHEFYKKKMNIDRYQYQQRNIDKGKSPLEQMEIQYQLRYLKDGNIIGLNELAHYKAQYDQVLRTGDFLNISFYVIELSNTPDFLCSSPHMPDYDFAGRTLQDVFDMVNIVDHFTYCLIATHTGGAAVFSWLGKSEAAEQFVKSLHALSDQEITHALVRFTFEYLENIFVSPTWWDNLDATAQRSLLNRQMAGLPHAPDRTANCLKDDGVRVVNWTVSSRKTNLII